MVDWTCVILSSAIASYLALGNNLETSIKLAKSYISGALKGSIAR